MPTFREQLLTDVTEICEKLYHRRLARVAAQQLVSDKAKREAILLILQLEQLRAMDPFPAASALTLDPITQLKADVAAEDGDTDAIQETLMDWARGVVGTGPPEAARAAPVTEPINQRMIDDLNTLRSAIDSTRIDLLINNDPYDEDAYTAARNAFTLARAVYEERLRLNQIVATNAQAARMEQVIIPGVQNATGATFPDTIQAGADFMSAQIFVIA